MITNPTDGLVELGATSGLLKVIDNIGTVLNNEINKDGLKIHIFGLSYQRIDENGNIYPVVPNQSLTDEINLLPGDLWPGYAFFDYKTNQKVQNGLYGNPRILTEVNLICFVNFKKISGMVKWTGDYRLYKEGFKSAIISIFATKMTTTGAGITLTEICDHNIDDVFEGYKLSLDRVQFYQQPYYAVRFAITINQLNKVC